MLNGAAEGYLRALCARVESGQYVPKAWATRYCDAIDPLGAGRHAEDTAPPPQNTPAQALDVTSELRIALKQLAVADSDGLSRVSLEQLRTARNGGRCGGIWNEITRLLQGLGYEVSKRPDGSYW